MSPMALKGLTLSAPRLSCGYPILNFDTLVIERVLFNFDIDDEMIHRVVNCDDKCLLNGGCQDMWAARDKQLICANYPPSLASQEQLVLKGLKH